MPGLPVVEVTSFVSPRAVPQLADAEEVVAGVRRRDGVLYPVLVPNMRGLERAEAAGVDAIAVFTAASESFTQANIGMTIGGSLHTFGPVLSRANDLGWWRRGYVSTAFGCPYEGRGGPCEGRRGVPDAPGSRVRRDLDRRHDRGCRARRRAARGFRCSSSTSLADRLALHLHDTHGRALENVRAGLELGIATYDSSAGGTGGCPYAPGAPGNLATESLCRLLDDLGIAHGVDADAVRAAAASLTPYVGDAHERRL